jgi:3-dehydroquinate dehydratase II
VNERPDVARRHLRIAVLHGPNLNLLGTREPDIYGRATLAEIDARLNVISEELGVVLTVAQHNSEGALIDAVQAWPAHGVDGALVNAGAYTHTSLALRDAITAVAIPFAEVHLSNIYAREPERRHSMLASAAIGMVAGFGANSYEFALRAMVAHLRVSA